MTDSVVGHPCAGGSSCIPSSSSVVLQVDGKLCSSVGSSVVQCRRRLPLESVMLNSEAQQAGNKMQERNPPPVATKKYDGCPLISESRLYNQSTAR